MKIKTHVEEYDYDESENDDYIKIEIKTDYPSSTSLYFNKKELLISVAHDAKNVHDGASIHFHTLKEAIETFEDLRETLKHQSDFYFLYKTIKIWPDKFDPRPRNEKCIQNLTKSELMEYIRKGHTFLKTTLEEETMFYNKQGTMYINLDCLGIKNYFDTPKFMFYQPAETGKDKPEIQGKIYEYKGFTIYNCYNLKNMIDFTEEKASELILMNADKIKIMNNKYRDNKYNYIYGLDLNLIYLTQKTTMKNL